MDERQTSNGSKVIVCFPAEPQVGVPKSESRWCLSPMHVESAVLCAGNGVLMGFCVPVESTMHMQLHDHDTIRGPLGGHSAIVMALENNVQNAFRK